jgi:predicted RNA-binding Zn-ribbon protein involved in translation (DUF1610 family)
MGASPISMTQPQNEILMCPACGLRIRRKQLERHSEQVCARSADVREIEGPPECLSPNMFSTHLVRCPDCGLRIRRSKLARHIENFCISRIAREKQSAQRHTALGTAITERTRNEPRDAPYQQSARVPKRNNLRQNPRDAELTRSLPRRNGRLAEEAQPKVPISTDPASIKHQLLSEIARADDLKRDWVPIREVKTVFRKRYTNRHSGNTYSAPDFGHKAFPNRDEGQVSEYQARPEEERYSIRAGTECEQASMRFLRRRSHPAQILSISPIDTILRFDSFGLKNVRTSDAHMFLTKFQ